MKKFAVLYSEMLYANKVVEIQTWLELSVLFFSSHSSFFLDLSFFSTSSFSTSSAQYLFAWLGKMVQSCRNLQSQEDGSRRSDPAAENGGDQTS